MAKGPTQEERLAAALRANLRRRKAERPAPTSASPKLDDPKPGDPGDPKPGDPKPDTSKPP